MRVVEEPVRLPVTGATLEGNLAIPDRAGGLVVFAHGSGSGRHSPRNRSVASALQSEGLGTLLLDLLTPAEDAADRQTGRFRFDIRLLASRLLDVTDELARNGRVAALPIGFFGASTGAGAALLAAAAWPENLRAVVSRGGRPDLAGGALARVRVPSLLIAGGADMTVLELNRAALRRIGAPRKELRVIPGASHLFPEPGALDEVSRLASDWFRTHLVTEDTQAHAM
jgi:putative phosphoribosyl transferase